MINHLSLFNKQLAINEKRKKSEFHKNNLELLMTIMTPNKKGFGKLGLPKLVFHLAINFAS